MTNKCISKSVLCCTIVVALLMLNGNTPLLGGGNSFNPALTVCVLCLWIRLGHLQRLFKTKLEHLPIVLGITFLINSLLHQKPEGHLQLPNSHHQQPANHHQQPHLKACIILFLFSTTGVSFSTFYTRWYVIFGTFFSQSRI